LTMPVFLAHGENDALMPVAEMRALAAKLAGRSDCTYTEVAGGDHDSPLARTPAVDWLLRRVAELRAK
jgi:pimeloyl-ACP methyl ester carboxylesterase